MSYDDNNPSLLREFADFRYATEHYGIVGDFSLKDVCLSSAAEIDELRANVAEAREAARIIWTDVGEPYVTTEDNQVIDPLECWPWLKEHDDDETTL